MGRFTVYVYKNSYIDSQPQTQTHFKCICRSLFFIITIFVSLKHFHVWKRQKKKITDKEDAI